MDKFSADMKTLINDVGNVDVILPQLLAQFPPIIAVAKSMRATLLTMHSSFTGLVTQMAQMTDTASAMGQAFDASKSGDYFYLPRKRSRTPTFSAV